MSILTPDRRLRVFVSSTLEELADERRAAREAIESLRLTPIMFEEGARPHPPRALYRAYLDQSDAFIGLYWQRYGWIAPGEETSGLEDEYQLSGDRPKLIYLKVPAPDREPRLGALIDRIRADDRVSYRRFRDVAELRSLIADDLAVLLTEHFTGSVADRASGARPRFALPRPGTRLIGRERDIERVEELLADQTTRLVTILGPGGVGKSRLALAVASRAKDRYAGGVVHVELAPVGEPGLLLPTIARALGVEERQGAEVAAQLRDRLDEERILIVLDNMEQLTDAADDLSPLMSRTSAVQLLVTSRRILGIRGERVLELEPLRLRDEHGRAGDAVDLFVDRAQAIRPGFVPDDDDLVVFEQLASRLDGLPLAIELASARLRVLTPQALLERVTEERLDLGRGPRDLPPRQRTLRDTIAWSYSLLAPEAKLVLARCSVFVGSADLGAIEAVADPDDSLEVLDVIADLVDASLVRATDGGPDLRFAMLETIREFAAEQLANSGEEADCRARHEKHYGDVARRADAALWTDEQVAWLDRLSRENDNFRAVLRRAILRDDATAALVMGRALRNYWMISGRLAEGRDWMSRIAALPGARPQERAAAATIGLIQGSLLGDFKALDSDADDALSAADPEDRRLAAFVRLMRAIAVGSADDGGEEGLTEASRSLEEAGEPLAAGLGLIAGSVLARVHGRLEEAYHLAEQAFELSQRMGESYGRAYAATQLARVALEMGDPERARRHALEGLRAAWRLRNVYASSYALELWATAELRIENAEQAGTLLALAERGYHLAGAGPWSTDAEPHAKLQADLQSALGDRYGQLIANGRRADLEQAIAGLLRSDQPSAARMD